MAIYETIFILDSLIPPKDIEATIQKYSEIITENGGSIREVDKWGKRRLAYEIQKKQYGFYVAIEFEGPGNIPRLLESDYNYNDKVLRFLTYRYDKNKLKAMEKDQNKDEIKAKSVVEDPKKEVVQESIMIEDTPEVVKDPLPEETIVEEIETTIEDKERFAAETPDSEEEVTADSSESEEEIVAGTPESGEEGEEEKS